MCLVTWKKWRAGCPSDDAKYKKKESNGPELKCSCGLGIALNSHGGLLTTAYSIKTCVRASLERMEDERSSCGSSPTCSRPVPVLLGDTSIPPTSSMGKKNNERNNVASPSVRSVLTIRRTTPGSSSSSSRGCRLRRRGSSLRLSRWPPCSLGGGDVRS